ncbi:MAG: L-serine ammonia-lyase, iron-sulfur-dependent, subunit alpha [Lachnospiraceae bacterium]|nr:L-serine ammonia-lyase, iron-sulfur-dependent, subunit alpha [Lachnospiraceae bacterium]
MEKENKKYGAYVQILKEELITAMGCTEPIALAYAAARCREILGKLPEKVIAEVSGSIIKNVKSVVVPNTGGMKGIKTAVAAGLVAGRPEKKLEVISEVSEAQREALHAYVNQVDMEISYLDSGRVFDIIIEAFAGKDTAKVRIANYHTNIVLEEHNGKKLLETVVEGDQEEGLTDRSLLDMEDIWDFAMTCEIEDVRAVLEHQIHCNMTIAEEGMKHPYGACIGQVMLDAYGNEIRNRACAKAAAGSDARMSGCELPVVINSGSGNQGITCSVPVIEYARELQVGNEKMYRALILSNLVAIHQKTGIGRLSAFCGAVCAGIAAGAGIAYLRGGGYTEVTHTVVNGLAIVSGIVCDGAKPSCAAKIAASVNAGILGYEMYVRGQQFYSGDGLVTKGADNTIRNIGRLGKEGMSGTNDEIIKIMIE